MATDFRALVTAELDTKKVQPTLDKLKPTLTISKYRLDSSALSTQLQAELSKHGFTVKIKSIDTQSIENAMSSAAVKSGTSFSKQLTDRINAQIQNGGIEASIARVTAQYEKLGTTGHDYLNKIGLDIRRLGVLQAAMANTTNTEALISEYQQFNTTLARVKNSLATVSATSKTFVSQLQINQLDSKMAGWLNANSKATKQYGATISELRNRLTMLSQQDNVTVTELREVEEEFKKVAAEAKSAGLSGRSFGDAFKGAITSISKYVSASTLIYKSISTLKEGVQTVVELDTALVDLEKTSTATASQLSRFYKEANSQAKELGVTTQEVIQSAADWSRLGYSLSEAQTMSRTSSIMQSISPGMDIETATDTLVSSMKAFDIAANDALDGIASKINAIGNTQAVSNNDIAEFLARSSAAMAEANNTLEETIALGTAATEITRDAANTGQVLKTMAMRIRGYDEETEEASEEVAELTGKIADLTKTAEHPMGISIFTDDTKETYKSTTQILREISQIYDELSDKQQAGVLEALGGKRNGQAVAAILSNFETVESSLETMKNSAGNAMKEMEVIQDSLTYKLNALKEAGVGVFQNLFEQEDLGEAIEFLTKLLEIIQKLTDELGFFGTVIAGLSIAAFIKNFEKIKNLGIEIAAIRNAGNVFEAFSSGAVTAKEAANALSMLNNEKKIAAVVDSALDPAEKALILDALGLSEAQIQEALSAGTASAAEKELSATTITTSQAFKALFTTLLTNPITWVVAAIAGLVLVLNHLSKAQEEAYESAQKMAEESRTKANEAINEKDRIKELIEKYKELKQSENSDSVETRQQISDIQGEIANLVGKQAENLDLVNGKLDEEIAKLNVIEQKSLDKATKKARTAYLDAEDEADSYIAHKGNWGSNWMYGSNDYAFGSGSQNVQADFSKLIMEAMRESNLAGFAKPTGMGQYATLEIEFSDNDTLTDRLNTLNGLIDKLRDNGYDGTDNIYKGLVESASEITDILDKQEAAARDYLTTKLESLASDTSSVNSLETFESFREGLITALESDDILEGALADKLLGEDEIESYVDTYISTLGSLDSYYQRWSKRNEKVAETNIDKIKKLYTLSPELEVNPQDAQSKIESFNAWIDNLPDDTKSILYTLDVDDEQFKEFTLNDWKEYVNELDGTDLFDRLGEDFSEYIDDYVDKVTILQDTLKDYANGDFTNKDLVELQEKFPELIGQTDNLDSAIENLLKEMNTNVVARFEEQFGKVETEEDKRKLEEYMKTVLKLGDVVGKTEFAIDIGVEIDDMENFYTAVKESVSATGLSAKSIENLKNRYRDLNNEQLDKLFERTEHGIHLNVQALRELESEYENTKKKKFKDELDTLVDKYNDLTEQINNCSDITEKANLYAQRQNVLDQINEVADLAAQYEGLTSAFNKWLEAQDTPDEDDMFQTLSKGLEDIIKLYESGRVGADDFREAVQLMTDVDLSNASIDELLEVYERGLPTMQKFFTDNGEGLESFLQTVKSVNDQLGEEWIWIDENGNWQFDFEVGGDEKIAKAITDMTDLQISTEEVQILLRALSTYGFDIDLDSALSQFDIAETDLETISSLVKKCNDELKEVGATDYTFYLDTSNVESLNTQIGEINSVIQGMYDSDGQLNVKYNEADLQNAKQILSALLAQKEGLNDACIMQIDTSSANSGIETVVQKLQHFQTAYSLLNSLVAVGADTTEASQQVEYWRGEILKEDTPLLASLKLDNTSVDAMYESINQITPEMLVTAGLDESKVQAFINKNKDTESTVTYDVDSKAVDDYIKQDKNASATVNYTPIHQEVDNYINSLHNLEFWVTYHYQHDGDAGRAGTAHAKGTAYAKGSTGRAFKSGDWGVKSSGTALMGEVGTETIVRDGKFFTVGDNGAGFYQYRKGDIIFNARQTEELFKHGRVSSNGGRGRTFVQGTAFSSGGGGFHGDGKGTVHVEPNNNNGGGGSSSSSSEKEQEPQTVDWIEILIDRIERGIERIKRKAESIYDTFSSRNKNIEKEMREIGKEIQKQQDAGAYYKSYAEGIDLPEWLKQKVRNGTIEISDYDADTAEKIEEYQKWYEKYLDCADAAEELQEKIKELYKSKFDLAVDNWTNKLEVFGHTVDRIASQIEQRTNKASEYVNPNRSIEADKKNINDYKKIVNNQKKQLTERQKELKDLNRQLNEALFNGAIAYGSEAYYEMLQQIHDVEDEIDNLNESIIENTNNIAAQYKAIFDDTKGMYENALNLAGKMAEQYSLNMEIAEAKGLMANAHYYILMRNQEQQNMTKLKQEQKDLVNALNYAVSSGAIQKYSDAWYEMMEAISDVNNAILESEKNIIEYNNQIRQIKWDNFDYLQDRISNITDETKFLISLLSNSSLYDDRGQLTNEGMATMGLYAIDYNTLMRQADNYAKEIKSINAELAKDPSNTDLIERRDELIKKHQESIKSAEAEKQAIQKLVKDGITAELKSLKDLISTYNDSLSAAKDLYDYQKKVTDQTKDISKLQKQLAAYQNDVTEETQAKIQKIRVELEEKQDSLRQTEYEHYISEQKKVLDNMYSDYESVLNERLDNIDSLIADMIDTVNDNSAEIATTLRDAAGDVGYSLTDEMVTILGNTSNATMNIVSTYGNNFSNKWTTTNKALTNIEKYVNQLLAASTREAYNANGGSTSTTYRRMYASGAKTVSSGLAWTNENWDKGGAETILRKSDHAVLTPLSNGSRIYNAMATENMWKMANNPSRFILDGISSIGKNFVGNAGGKVSNISQDNQIVFNLPNVSDYDSFLAEMQRDKRFEQLVQAITIDPLNGKNISRKKRINI